MNVQAERMTQSEVSGLIRTAVYIAVGIPIPAGAAAAVFFLPHSRYVGDTLDKTFPNKSQIVMCA